MKGYKGFDKNPRRGGFQFEVGKEYKLPFGVSICSRGFHFCASLKDVHEYYNPHGSRICEVEALGSVVTGGNKSVTDRIKILREINREELLFLCNADRKNKRNNGNKTMTKTGIADNTPPARTGGRIYKEGGSLPPGTRSAASHPPPRGTPPRRPKNYRKKSLTRFF